MPRDRVGAEWGLCSGNRDQMTVLGRRDVTREGGHVGISARHEGPACLSPVPHYSRELRALTAGVAQCLGPPRAPAEGDRLGPVEANLWALSTHKCFTACLVSFLP